MEKVQMKLIQCPSYLGTLLGSKDQKIYFCSYRTKPLLTTDVKSSSMDETMEFIGNPLEVDLGVNDIVIPISMNPKPWAPEENEHRPMSLDMAREKINQHNMEIFKKNKGINPDYPIFCVCDMKDDKKTFMLGSLSLKKKIVTTKVMYHGLDDMYSGRFNVEFMRAKHKKYAFDTKIGDIETYESSYTYDLTLLYQNKLYLVVKTNACDSNTEEPMFKMIFKIHAITDQSKYYSGWADLKFIEKLLNMLKNSIDDLSPENNGLDLKELQSKLQQFITIQLANQDFTKLKVTILEMWDFIKQAQTVADLQQYFYMLFFLLACKENSDNKSQANNEMLMLQLINAVQAKCHGVIDSVPKYISMYLLIELGLEKLKNYYCSVISNHIKKTFTLEDWSSIPKVVNIDDKITFLESNETSSALLNAAKLNLKKIENLHVLVEMCDLLTVTTLKTNINNLVDKYTKLGTILENPFEESYSIEPHVDQNLKNLYTRQEPIASSFMQVTNWKKDNWMKSIFYKSKVSIIPPNLLNGADVVPADANTDNLFHVLQLREFVYVL